MPNIVAVIENAATEGNNINIGVTFITPDSFQAAATIQIASSELNGTVAQVNTAIKTAAAAYMSTNFGITLVGGDKVLIIGGVA